MVIESSGFLISIKRVIERSWHYEEMLSVFLLLALLLGAMPLVVVADVNGDNKIDSTYARLVLQHAVGKIQKFPNQ